MNRPDRSKCHRVRLNVTKTNNLTADIYVSRRFLVFRFDHNWAFFIFHKNLDFHMISWGRVRLPFTVEVRHTRDKVKLLKCCKSTEQSETKHPCCNIIQECKLYTPPKTNISQKKMLIGRQAFPFEMVSFQGRHSFISRC